MKTAILYFLVATLCVGCANTAQQLQDDKTLASLPADAAQTTPAQWVKAIPSYPLTSITKAEIDLSSVHPTENGGITVWERESYERTQRISADYSFKITEAQYLFDCAKGTFSILRANTRKANGDLARSKPMPDYSSNFQQTIPPRSLISTEAKLACEQAKKNWPTHAGYDLQIHPIEPALTNEASATTPAEKEDIQHSLARLRQADKSDLSYAATPLTPQHGENTCQAMNNVDETPSSIELCVASGLFSHDIYSVRANHAVVVKGIDDETTKGIDGILHEHPVKLKCDPVNQLASDITASSLANTIASLKKSMPNATFEARKNVAISMNLIETGRHCALSDSGGLVAKMDVKWPD